MKKLYYLPFLFFMASLVLSPTILHAQGKTVSIDEAKSVLEQYFNCLKNGNTSEILNLITGPLLKQREAVLKNYSPYASFLQNRYKDAYLVITSGGFSENGLISLHASIYFNPQQKTNFIFNLISEGSNGSLKIYSEEEIP